MQPTSFTLPTKLTPKKSIYLWLFIFGVLVFFIYKLQNIGADFTYESIKTGVVRIGTLKQVSLGTGKLQSSVQRIISAPNGGTVEKIYMYPGSEVTEDSIVILLSNSKLDSQLADIEYELKKNQILLLKTVSDAQLALITDEQALLELNKQYKKTELEYQIVDKLAESGIASKLEQKKLQLDVDFYKEQHNLLKKKSLLSGKVRQTKINAQEELISLISGKFEKLKAARSNLEVRAGIKGFIQNIDIKIGQTLSHGEKIGDVGSVDELKAVVKIPQNALYNLKVGMKVYISNTSGQALGKVERIEPTIKDSNITVQVRLENNLPSEFRPQMNVKAKIIFKTSENVLLVDIPHNAIPNQINQIYIIKNSNAIQKDVLFGEASANKIEVLDGLSSDDQIIISNTNLFKEKKEIAFVNK
ncbi:efflux RND transporter periplasmic adaptor subunit [Colwellia sp. BRX10-4]|jgi:HlyD family secretion protein|uniref:efflux RND transporter periplasmic adaptor subunit n=1 Tax=Colwellia sp. BRX10-4 TaxID=2759843 RepID=UPI0015F6AC1D|nr:efflux RND transporter periplasmic adaptor subunit [Colwellia sp. BRX10-4]MBA6397609.1 efflux RND transporter periplasmic adaptor subunit [Colwellia sp. BRX10-4]